MRTFIVQMRNPSRKITWSSTVMDFTRVSVALEANPSYFARHVPAMLDERESGVYELCKSCPDTTVSNTGANERRCLALQLNVG